MEVKACLYVCTIALSSTCFLLQGVGNIVWHIFLQCLTQALAIKAHFTEVHVIIRHAF